MTAIQIVTGLALLAALTSCGRQQTQAYHPAGGARPADASAAGSPQIDRSGTVEQQLARLQDVHDRNAEAIDFLNRVYAQQKAQQAEQERNEPAQDAVFAVDIAPNVKLGMVEGSPQALVTIVEAWDFA